MHLFLAVRSIVGSESEPDPTFLPRTAVVETADLCCTDGPGPRRPKWVVVRASPARGLARSSPDDPGAHGRSAPVLWSWVIMAGEFQRLVRAGSLAGVIVLGGGIAVAQSTPQAAAAAPSAQDVAAARALATQGLHAYEAQQFSQALDLFTRAQSLLHAPTHMLYMARSAAKLGQVVRAQELYMRIVREELPADAPEAFRDAQKAARGELKAVEPRIAQLTITIDAPKGTNASVQMDGKEVPAAVVGVSFPVDPGKHELLASAPGFRGEPQSVQLAEGAHQSVTLELKPDAAVAPAAAPVAPTAPAAAAGALTAEPSPEFDNEPERSGWMRTGSYIGFGVGVVGLAAGTYFLLDSRSKRSDADALAKECGPDCLASDPRAADISSLDDDARRAQTFSIVSYVVGGLGVATGTALFVLSARSSKSSPEASLQVTPVVGLGSAALVGRF